MSNPYALISLLLAALTGLLIIALAIRWRMRTPALMPPMVILAAAIITLTNFAPAQGRDFSDFALREVLLQGGAVVLVMGALLSPMRSPVTDEETDHEQDGDR